MEDMIISGGVVDHSELDHTRLDNAEYDRLGKLLDDVQSRTWFANHPLYKEAEDRIKLAVGSAVQGMQQMRIFTQPGQDTDAKDQATAEMILFLKRQLRQHTLSGQGVLGRTSAGQVYELRDLGDGTTAQVLDPVAFVEERLERIESFQKPLREEMARLRDQQRQLRLRAREVLDEDTRTQIRREEERIRAEIRKLRAALKTSLTDAVEQAMQ